MANTYSQINIHCVFSIQGRENFITKHLRDDLHKYMAGILKKRRVISISSKWLDGSCACLL